MPQTVTIGAFVLGSVLILIAILGGRFKIFGAEISGTTGRIGRIVSGIAGTILVLLGAVGSYYPTSSTPISAPEPTTHITPLKGDPKNNLIGEWQQLRFDPVSKGWVSGGVYQVFAKNNTLHMSTIETWTAPSNSTRSLEVSNVSFDGQHWSFESKWDIGVIATFRLKKIDENTFEGYSWVEGQQVEKNRWLRLK